jgi:predicted amidohydrolase YtcJ
MAVPEEWNRVGRDNPHLVRLVDKFRVAHASVTPTLHVFAERLGLTYFESPPRDPSEDTSSWSASDRARAVQGYRVMASYVKRLNDAGVRLNIGTDTPDPGKSVLSEMLLLHDAGISMRDVFRIATLDSAQGIGHGTEYGSVEVGKRANLILFEGDPLGQPFDLLRGKTVIKDGVVVR